MSGKSRARRHHPVPRHEQQIFQFGALSFDVGKAHQLLRHAPRPRRRIPVEPWARLCGLDDNSGSLIAPGPTFDRAYAMTTDLSRPVILALLETEDQLGNPILIDGCHRLYHANARGVIDLPAYQLTVTETRMIRLV